MERQGLVKKGEKLIIFYNDGVKVIRRDVTFLDEDDNFIYCYGGYFFNKNFIVRMEATQR